MAAEDIYFAFVLGLYADEGTNFKCVRADESVAVNSKVCTLYIDIGKLAFGENVNVFGKFSCVNTAVTDGVVISGRNYEYRVRNLGNRVLEKADGVG